MKKKKSNDYQINAKVDRGTYREIVKRSIACDTTLSEYMRLVIEDHIRRFRLSQQQESEK